MSLEHGFEVLGESQLPEYRSTTLWARHKKSGCEFFHVRNDDDENLFSFAFKTLPSDSSGVAHILEHVVLCGSQQFRVKDPLILLVKGSLNTFLNAMTYPDKTVYPASSTVPQDLFNLMKVYGDAVFFPLVSEQMFQQEGHRLQFDEEGKLEVTGIVYNEMKGVAANHDSIAGEWAYRSLLPNTPYAYDSGGEPKEILNLSYEEFREFHRTYYHPSNTRVFVYGNIPSAEYMEFLDREFLSRFSSIDVSAEVSRQPRWNEPRELVKTCPTDGTDGPTSVTINWLLDPITDPYRLLATEMMAAVLLSTSGAPLRKRLIESGLGEDLAGPTGIETDLLEMVFSVGLRGIDENRKGEMEAVVFDELARLVSEGINPDVVEAALRKVEFRYREIRGGGPNGLRLMGKSLRGWIHGEPPDSTLRFHEPFERLRSDVAAGRFFEQLIEEKLLHNTHRTTLTVKPDPGQGERENRELEQWLSTIEAGLSETDLQSIREQQVALFQMQAAPDSAEAVAAIPFLTTGDLPRDVETIPSEKYVAADGVEVYTHDVFSNGVVYLDVGFDLAGLDASMTSYLPLYTAAVTEVGLPGREYDQVATEIAMKTGGLGAFTEASLPVAQPSRADRRLYFRMKCLESVLPEAVDLLIDLVRHAQFGNSDRLADIIKEERSGIKSGVLPSGHSFASLRSSRGFADSSRYDEAWRGIAQLLFLSEVEADTQAGAVGELLTAMNEAVIRRGNMVVNVTGSQSAITQAKPQMDRLIESVPAGRWEKRVELPADAAPPRAEALVVPSNVNYVAAALQGARFGSPQYVHESVVGHLLSTGYLWEAVRMTGGAYGVGASARGLDGVFGFWSYRDPNIVDTLAAYRTGLARLAEEEVSSEDLDLAIIGVTGRDIRPLSPGEKSLVSLRRSLYGITDEMRQAKRDAILATSSDDVRTAAGRLIASMRNGSVVVMGGERAIAEAAPQVEGMVEHQIRLPI